MAFNIITNNCLGGHIYRDVLKTEYKNPFIWCFLEPYFDFIQNYPNINLFNYKLEKIDKKLGRFKIVIDNKYELKFWHYYFDKNAENPIINGRNVRYNKIWEYIVQKYEKRLTRMDKTDEIVFCYYDNNLTNEQFEILKNLSLTNKVLIFNNNFLLNDTNIKCFKINEQWQEPALVCDKYSNEIKKFLKVI